MLDLIHHVNSGPKSELVWHMPMTTWHPYVHNIAYQIHLRDLRKGDLLVFNLQGECTSEHQYNVQVCSYVSLSPHKHDIGKPISQPYGGNVTRNEHHRPFNSTGSWEVEHNGDFYLNGIVYVASTAAGPNDVIILEQDYGRLFVLVYRKSRGTHDKALYYSDSDPD